MKISQRTKNDKAHAAVKGWCVKLISTVIVGCIATSAGHTSDLEIYQGAIGGNASILMMLDNSLSMNEKKISHIKQDYPSVNVSRSYYDRDEPVVIFRDDGSTVDTSTSYGVTYRLGTDGKEYYDRISRLKMALIPMLANPKNEQKGFGPTVDLSKYKIGLGSFFGGRDAGGGIIDAPVADLTLANRKVLINKLKNLEATTYTPIANAYAEAGAYMLGTTTQTVNTEIRYEEVGYLEHRSNNNDKYYLYKCDPNTNSSIVSTFDNVKYYACNSRDYTYKDGNTRNRNDIDFRLLGTFDNSKNRTVRTQNGSETYYYKRVEVDVGANPASGFSRSDESTKKQPGKLTYQSPLPDVPNQCDGYGIYFLTDGEPNNAHSEVNTRGVMNSSLEGGASSIGNSCESLSAPSPMITSNGTRYQNDGTSGRPAWECIGEYATKLYDKGNSKKALIATATVGFGKVFEGLTDKTSKTIRRPSGKVETVEVYQCELPGVNKDAQNLCKLGEKGYGYGQGGFYYAAESKDIASSLKSFIEDVGSAEIDPISTGTMSVPLDSLGGLKSRKFAYLPILEPAPGSQRLWNGNLKKYNVKNGTLVGKDGDFVFADNTGLFSRDNIDENNINNNAGTYDLWNTINVNRPDTTKPDGGLPQVGGAYQQIFENANAPIVGDRNLFVDTGNSLTNLKVTNKKPENFVSLTNGTENNNAKKLALLKFMGYSVTDTVTDGTELSEPQNKDLKNIGGVLHSTPQLITQSVAVDASGQFDTSKRKDYIIYGSMDGALHMLDDSTGKETFTFVPKQILDLQPDALAGNGNGTAVDGSYPYGVDAPWLTYVAYTTKSKIDEEEKTTTNTYEAAQSFALGGLRMGGSMYYALDVTKVNEPKMIYSVGSNYANRQKGDNTVALSGNKNGVINNTADEQKAYARMGQTWGKPTLGYVKSGGERVMVSFLPGGYDACYEDPQFKLGNSANSESCADKSKAQGNAVYMVQMGEVEDATNDTDGTPVSNGEETVDISDGNSGKLLWWASNKGDSANYTSRSTSLQYSRDDDLKHSIVTQVRAIDRNYDGLTDHIYFADLGGQVWRADINNNKDTDTFKVDRVVKVLDVSDQATGTDAPPRIYERPLITFFNGKYGYKNAANEKVTYSGVQAMITVGTGDRSSPVSAERNTPDALYTVIDKDVSRKDLFYYGTGTAPTISLRTPVIEVGEFDDETTNNKLQQLKFSVADIGNNGIRQNMVNNKVQGWYMPFTYWDDAAVSTSKYKLKMFNEPDAIAGVLISSTYNPDEGQDIQACSAGVKGSTQRERTCLPYGSCPDALGNVVLTARSTFNAGSGIVDNIISQYNDTSIFGSLVNRCEGDDCEPKPICSNGNCSYTPPTVNSGINVDKRLNPLSWMEH